ncbi:MAG: hypothetical protein O7D34_05085 [Ignavibacteria bacterium]|nr:hypothetical protein [Ignavibacteria bacterium]
MSAGAGLLGGGNEEEPEPDVASAGVKLFGGAAELVAAGLPVDANELFNGGKPSVGRGAAGAEGAGFAAGFLAAAGFEGGFLNSS